jgi:5'(3')-deoxyribonucleotidase
MSFAQMTPEQLKEELLRRKTRGLALDIDDTLCQTDNHWVTCMSARFGNPEGLTRRTLVERYGCFEKVPQWQSEEAAATIIGFQHSSDFVRTIPAVEGAARAVKEITQTIPIVAYITARPHKVFEGTIEWLKKEGFPEAPIVFRPEEITHAEKHIWKASVLHDLYPLVEGIIDDHPGLSGQLERLGYRGTLYVYKSGCDMDATDQELIFETWDEIAQTINGRRQGR